MNIKDIPYTEYFYIFEIDNVKYACLLMNQLIPIIRNCATLSNQRKNQLYTYIKDFTQVSDNLISRKTINNYYDYENSMRALVIINAKIQATINQSNIIDTKIIKNIFKQINSFLSYSHTIKDIFVQNYSISLILISLLIVLISIIIYTIYKPNINTIVLLCLIILLIFIFIMLLSKSIFKQHSKNKSYRIINKNTHINSRNIKSLIKNLEKLTHLSKNK